MRAGPIFASLLLNWEPSETTEPSFSLIAVRQRVSAASKAGDRDLPEGVLVIFFTRSKSILASASSFISFARD